MYSAYLFTTSSLDGGELLESRPGRYLLPGKEPPLPIGQEAGVGGRVGLEEEVREKILLTLPGIEPRSPSHPVCNQTLN
jgi:hypothetical protein